MTRPVITTAVGQHLGAVTEAGNLDDGNVVAGTPSTGGTLTSSDVDADHTAAWSGNATGTYGAFAINAASGVWTYTLDNSDTDTQALKEGQTVTESFTATVTDDFGATATQVVTITITGTNDSPVITSNAAAAAGAVIEAGNLDNGSVVAGTPSASGTLTSSDVDADHTATWSGNATGTYGAFAINAASGVWTYTLDNSDTDTQALKEGQTVTESFTATVTDDFGATATEVVTLTITGTNDSPVITTAVGQNLGAVTEAGNLDDGSVVAGTPSTGGTLTSSDVDADHTAAWSGNATGTYGAFAINAASGVWTYTLDNSDTDTQALKEGQTVTESFTATVTDDFGATATQVVTLTITGTNDSPGDHHERCGQQPARWRSRQPGQRQRVAGTPSASGTLTSSDVDTDHTAAWSGNATGTYGAFAINAASGVWTYTLDNATPDTQALKEGQTVTETFTATVTDDFGATATEVVTMTITGTNDSPVITTAVGQTLGAVSEAGNLDDGNGVAGTPSASGTLTSSDVDAGHTADVERQRDRHVWGVRDQCRSGVWTYTLDNATPTRRR